MVAEELQFWYFKGNRLCLSLILTICGIKQDDYDLRNTVPVYNPLLKTIENTIMSTMYSYHTCSLSFYKTHTVHYSPQAHGMPDTNILMIHKR